MILIDRLKSTYCSVSIRSAVMMKPATLDLCINVQSSHASQVSSCHSSIQTSTSDKPASHGEWLVHEYQYKMQLGTRLGLGRWLSFSHASTSAIYLFLATQSTVSCTSIKALTCLSHSSMVIKSLCINGLPSWVASEQTFLAGTETSMLTQTNIFLEIVITKLTIQLIMSIPLGHFFGTCSHRIHQQPISLDSLTVHTANTWFASKGIHCLSSTIMCTCMPYWKTILQMV